MLFVPTIWSYFPFSCFQTPLLFFVSFETTQGALSLAWTQRGTASSKCWGHLLEMNIVWRPSGDLEFSLRIFGETPPSFIVYRQHTPKFRGFLSLLSSSPIIFSLKWVFVVFQTVTQSHINHILVINGREFHHK